MELVLGDFKKNKEFNDKKIELITEVRVVGGSWSILILEEEKAILG